MLMMNVSIVLALILISLVFQSKAKLDQTDQLWDEVKVKQIVRNIYVNKIPEARIIYLLSLILLQEILS